MQSFLCFSILHSVSDGPLLERPKSGEKIATRSGWIPFLFFDATRRRISAPTTDLGRLLSVRPTEQGLLRRKALQSKGRDSQTFTAGAGERGKRRMSRRPRAATQRARNIGDPRRKTGILRGIPLNGFWVLLSAQKYRAAGRTNHRIDTISK